jgi:hypothetical protein|tara:strand:+ start:317 stop:1183 length:867 start_codon:yes stop_codon:yes gene_type:complete
MAGTILYQKNQKFFKAGLGGVVFSALSGAASFGIYVDALILKSNELGYLLPPISTLLNLQVILANIGDTILNKMDVLQIYSADAGTENFCTLNVINPSIFQANLNNAPVLNKGGVIVVGSTASYIISNFSPSNGSNYTLNNNHYQIDIKNDLRSSFSSYFGVIDSISNSGSSIRTLASLNRLYGTNNNLVNFVTVPSGYFLKGLHSTVRTTSTDFKDYNNSVEYSSRSETASGLATLPMFIGTTNEEGVTPPADRRPDNQFGFFSAGASLTTSEMTTIKTQMDLYYAR